MKKNIIIAALIILTTLSFVYALYQKTEAEKQMQLADENAQRAVEIEVRVYEQMHIAEVNQIEAERQRQIAIDCARKKK